MKRIVLYILITISACACSNEKSPSELFLDDFFDEQVSFDDEVICINYFHGGDHLLQYIEGPFADDTVRIEGYRRNSLVLTREEKSMIINTLRSLKPDSSHVDFYIDREIVSSDTIDALLQNPEKGWPYFRKKYREGYYTVSKPIFFRENTLCLFSYSYSCGMLCGGGNISIYKKTLFGWRSYISFYDWIS
ncbi:MAG TPA: hypothetical protein VIM75_07240 [Ohtaekwangia sp.]|uniref:hypothetical protein n=1 Tax=Ohtaekwangia sp. TaxID=2066019 RepID=UPI002F95C865